MKVLLAEEAPPPCPLKVFPLRDIATRRGIDQLAGRIRAELIAPARGLHSLRGGPRQKRDGRRRSRPLRTSGRKEGRKEGANRSVIKRRRSGRRFLLECAG